MSDGPSDRELVNLMLRMQDTNRATLELAERVRRDFITCSIALQEAHSQNTELREMVLRQQHHINELKKNVVMN